MNSRIAHFLLAALFALTAILQNSAQKLNKTSSVKNLEQKNLTDKYGTCTNNNGQMLQKTAPQKFSYK